MKSRSLPYLVPAVLLALLLSACDMLEPPVTVSQRESAVGQGQVVEITNTSDKFLYELRVQILSPEGETKEYFTASLKPHGKLSVGWLKLDGWPIPQGSTVTVGAKGYVKTSGPWD
jgi:hypothetical protein